MDITFVSSRGSSLRVQKLEEHFNQETLKKFSKEDLCDQYPSHFQQPQINVLGHDLDFGLCVSLLREQRDETVPP
jgi:hypothetical protein